MGAFHGREGEVVWSTMTHLDTNVNSWTLSFAGDEEDTTSFGGPTKAKGWPRTYIPGLTQWSGSYEARLDDTNAATMQPSDVGTQDYIILRTGKVAYKGSAFITGWDPTNPVDGVATNTVTFRGTDTLTISDSS